MKTEKGLIQKHEYKAEIKQLLDLIVHSLYTHPEVFLRELISNASDALNRVRFRKLTEENILDAEVKLEIKIEADPKKHTFSIEDTGIGMTEAELIANIGTLARSGTLEFLKTMKDKQKSVDDDLIGRFGVGFYSVFMITDEVTVETRHADPNSKGYKWKSGGEGTYTIEEIDKKTRGTKISFKLKESAKEFSEEYKIKETINKYSNFADFPILFKEEKVNTVSALWHKNKKDIKEDELNEFYKFTTNNFDEPMGHLHLSIEGTVSFKALVFIPGKAPHDIFRLQTEKSLHLYANKILIQSDCKDLLPEYLRFVKGVVDTIDLPLNVSREVTQASPVMGKIKRILIREIFALLKNWAEKDKEKYKKFYDNFSHFLKAGVNADFENRTKLVELLRFESSATKDGEKISLKEYETRMKKDQKEIYFISGENRSALAQNPNLEYFKKNKIEVLLLTDPADIFIVPSLGEYGKKPITSIGKVDIDLLPEDKIEKPEDNLSKSLIAVFKNVLKDKVEDVVISKRLVDSPVTLVSGKDSMDPQMEKIMKLMNRDLSYPTSKKTMEVNISHSLIRNLAKIYMADPGSFLLEKCILHLYEGALFIEGNLPSPIDYVRRMSEIMEEATK